MGSITIFKPLSTFLQPVLLINLSNIDNFSFDKTLGSSGFKHGGAGQDKYATSALCSPPVFSSINPNGPLGHKFQVSANSSAKFTLSEVTTASPSSSQLSPSTRTPAGGRSAGQCWASAAGSAWPPWLGRSTLAEATMGTHFSDPSRSSILWIASKIFS